MIRHSDGESGFFRSADGGAREDADTYPLTEAQREIWFLAQIGVAHCRAYHESVLAELTGELDVGVLGAAVDEVVGRHESLRTVFARDGSHQRVLPRSPVGVAVVDLSDPAAGPAEEQARSWCDRAAAEVFDLESGPLVRAAMLR